MLHKIKNIIARQTKVAGVSIRLQSDNSYLISYALLEIKKGAIHIIAQSKVDLQQLSELKLILPADYPVVLHVDGKGFLHKQLENNIGDETKVVSKIIPNAKDEDFYLQKYNTTNGGLLSIIRKSGLDDLLNELKLSGIQPVAISFGAYVLNSILEFIPHLADGSENVAGYKLNISNNVISSFINHGETDVAILIIGDDKVNSTSVAAYAVGLEYLLSTENFCSSIVTVNQYASEWREEQLFKKLGWGMLIFFLVLLLINFTLFSWFSDTNKELQQQRYGSGNYYSLIESLQNQLKKKEGFLKQAGWFTPSKVSFFADRLAATVPASIKLASMQLMPVEEVMENENKKLIFNQNVIMVGGTCPNPTELNSWIKSMEQFKWIEKVKLNDYKFDQREHVANFKLNIQVRF